MMLLSPPSNSLIPVFFLFFCQMTLSLSWKSIIEDKYDDLIDLMLLPLKNLKNKKTFPFQECRSRRRRNC